MADALEAGAIANPDTLFALVDGVAQDQPARRTIRPTTPTPQRRLLVFAEEQGSFLVGAAAALKSQTGKIGFIGGVENDLIKKFEAGYIAGAKAVNPDIEILSNYITQPPDFTGFNDPAKGKEIAAAMYADGADVDLPAAGGIRPRRVRGGHRSRRARRGVGDRRRHRPVQTWSTPALQPYILTSMLKRVDVAVYETIEAEVERRVRGGIQVFDLVRRRRRLLDVGRLRRRHRRQLEDFKEQIIAGEIEVPTAP